MEMSSRDFRRRDIFKHQKSLYLSDLDWNTAPNWSRDLQRFCAVTELTLLISQPSAMSLFLNGFHHISSNLQRVTVGGTMVPSAPILNSLGRRIFSVNAAHIEHLDWRATEIGSVDWQTFFSQNLPRLRSLAFNYFAKPYKNLTEICLLVSQNAPRLQTLSIGFPHAGAVPVRLLFAQDGILAKHANLNIFELNVESRGITRDFFTSIGSLGSTSVDCTMESFVLLESALPWFSLEKVFVGSAGDGRWPVKAARWLPEIFAAVFSVGLPPKDVVSAFLAKPCLSPYHHYDLLRVFLLTESLRTSDGQLVDASLADWLLDLVSRHSILTVEVISYVSKLSFSSTKVQQCVFEKLRGFPFFHGRATHKINQLASVGAHSDFIELLLRDRSYCSQPSNLDPNWSSLQLPYVFTDRPSLLIPLLQHPASDPFSISVSNSARMMYHISRTLERTNADADAEFCNKLFACVLARTTTDNLDLLWYEALFGSGSWTRKIRESFAAEIAILFLETKRESIRKWADHSFLLFFRNYDEAELESALRLAMRFFATIATDPEFAGIQYRANSSILASWADSGPTHIFICAPVLASVLPEGPETIANFIRQLPPSSLLQKAMEMIYKPS